MILWNSWIFSLFIPSAWPQSIISPHWLLAMFYQATSTQHLFGFQPGPQDLGKKRSQQSKTTKKSEKIPSLFHWPLAHSFPAAEHPIVLLYKAKVDNFPWCNIVSFKNMLKARLNIHAMKNLILLMRWFNSIYFCLGMFSILKLLSFLNMLNLLLERMEKEVKLKENILSYLPFIQPSPQIFSCAILFCFRVKTNFKLMKFPIN